MPSTDETKDWAKQLTVAAFTECGVRLREGDSLVLVATVFRKVLEAWSESETAALAGQVKAVENAGANVAERTRAVVAEEFGAQALKLRTELLEDAESASVKAVAAVDKALGIPKRQDLWRARVQGAFGGAGFVLLGALLMHWFGR